MKKRWICLVVENEIGVLARKKMKDFDGNILIPYENYVTITSETIKNN